MVSNRTNERKVMKIKVNTPKIRTRGKILIIKSTIGLLTAAVIGAIVKEEVKVLDEMEARYLAKDDGDDQVIDITS